MFEEKFLLVNISIELFLKMPFPSFNNINIKFVELKKLTQRSYNIIEVLLTTNRIEFIDKKYLLKQAWIKISRSQ